MFPQFQHNYQLGQAWNSYFNHERHESVYLHTQDTLAFNLLCLTVNSGHIAPYARDALHYALVAEYRDRDFWSFLLHDTYNMEHLFNLDQHDIVIVCLLIIEQLNHAGFHLPSTCFDLCAARCSQAPVTDATGSFLACTNFLPLHVDDSSPVHDEESDTQSLESHFDE